MSGGRDRPYNAGMPDLLFVVLTVGFFVLAAGLVTVCDRIIGPDADHDVRGHGLDDAEPAAEPATEPVTAGRAS